MAFEHTLSRLDLELLSLHWVAIDRESVVVLNGNGLPLPLKKLEQILDRAWEKIAKLCANQGFKQAWLYGEGNKRYCIPADFVSCSDRSNNNDDDNQPLNISTNSNPDAINRIPEEELTIGMLERSSLPTYINAIKTQKKFYANLVALNAQGKPPEEFLEGNAYDLNDPDELDYRTSLIVNDERLRSYEYQAWRWYFDGDAGRFRLKRMHFVSSFRLLRSFNGVPCWLGQVEQANELQSRRL
ncbi:MAG: hypothetical protein SAL07_25485 [Oscillatoria sp. PMC 1051.18]|nr:hypothetical protein [Oscillatoria sp. PMC 1050.18]MEC5033261.1 hypothetical protein [Oscillatoria sp. PMC 1051.18]